MINERKFLIDEYNAGRLWRKKSNKSLYDLKDNCIRTHEAQYLKAREILKKAGESADKPLTVDICRALAEGFLQPDFKIKDNNRDREQP